MIILCFFLTIEKCSNSYSREKQYMYTWSYQQRCKGTTMKKKKEVGKFDITFWQFFYVQLASQWHYTREYFLNPYFIKKS